jgi:hypothetical protein
MQDLHVQTKMPYTNILTSIGFPFDFNTSIITRMISHEVNALGLTVNRQPQNGTYFVFGGGGLKKTVSSVRQFTQVEEKKGSISPTFFVWLFLQKFCA